MVWKPTATTLTWPPVSFSQSGARRWSGSATCGPLNVRMLMLTPANLVPGDAAAVGADEAGADAADAGADAGVVAAGDALGVAVLQPAITTTRAIAAAIDGNRDTASSSS